MEFLNTIQVSLFAFIILLLIFINIKRSYRYILFDQKLFLNLILITLFLLLADMARAFANSKTTQLMKNINLISLILTYSLAPITSFTWAMYVDYKIYENKLRLQKKFSILSFPLIINTLFIFLNLFPGRFYGTMFSINKQNIYSRGPYFYIVIGISYLYLLYTFVNILKNKENLYKKDYYSLLIFIVPPLIGSIAQTIFYGINLTWINLTLSIFIIYMNIQNKQLSLDVLTGLYNRRKLNMYLDSTLYKNKTNIIGGIMIDLDDFKYINDTFGHK